MAPTTMSQAWAEGIEGLGVTVDGGTSRGTVDGQDYQAVFPASQE